MVMDPMEQFFEFDFLAFFKALGRPDTADLQALGVKIKSNRNSSCYRSTTVPRSSNPRLYDQDSSDDSDIQNEPLQTSSNPRLYDQDSSDNSDMQAELDAEMEFYDEYFRESNLDGTVGSGINYNYYPTPIEPEMDMDDSMDGDCDDDDYRDMQYMEDNDYDLSMYSFPDIMDEAVEQEDQIPENHGDDKPNPVISVLFKR